MEIIVNKSPIDKMNMNLYKLLEYCFKVKADVVINRSILATEFVNSVVQNIVKYDNIDTCIPCEYIKNNQEIDGRIFFKSYPRKNILMIMAHNMLICLKKKRFIFEFDPLPGFDDKTEANVLRISKILLDQEKQIDEMLDFLSTDSFSLEEERYIDMLLNLLALFGDRGLLTLLGIRQTPGSYNGIIPPDSELLIQGFLTKNFTFNENPKAKSSILTVGARALCKHSHRCSQGFWPESKGSENEKNLKANKMLDYFLNECIWINIHALPHDIPVIELRVNGGYGIRWRVDGSFRGFLEPHMEKGHEVGWKH